MLHHFLINAYCFVNMGTGCICSVAQNYLEIQPCYSVDYQAINVKATFTSHEATCVIMVDYNYNYIFAKRTAYTKYHNYIEPIVRFTFPTNYKWINNIIEVNK